MMGRQITQVFAQYGHQVNVTDENKDAFASGLREISDGRYGVKSAVSRGKLTEEQASNVLESIRTFPSTEEACR
ncbi:3-hydroxyacyl-CoA dehydrogenase family protein, partial [Candidatus Bathyarchaeota archaeon]|nr:3-hydroxyacyl-CoA dehydrogenase family protein [Candidatus Bathyarchaeota archaeon]